MKAYRNNQRRTSIVDVIYDYGTNTLNIEGLLEEISLNNLEPVSVVSNNFVIMANDDIDISEVEAATLTEETLFSGSDGNYEILVGKDINDQISLIDIFDGENTTSLVADFASGDFVKLTEDEELLEIDPAHNHTSDVVDIPPYDPNATSNIFLAQSGCGRRRSLNIAVATNADFCQWSGKCI